MVNLGRAGLIGRFKPLHNGGALMLEEVCKSADHVIIGIGSSNKYNMRSPFTAEESQKMIDAYLKPNFNNYEFIQVPDFAHIPKYQDGQKWRQYVVDTYGKLDCFVSGNPYVTELMKNDYPIIHPAKLIAQEKWIPLRATMVRMAMAAGEDYRQLVPKEVADYLEKNGLVERFRKEFGLKTIATLQEKEWISKESMLEEKLHTTTG